MKHLLYLGPSSRESWCHSHGGWHISACSESTGPAWIVTDLAGESFAEIEMPRLFGRDRAAFIARQMVNRFPDTPYRSALNLGSGGLIGRMTTSRQVFLGVSNADRLDAELGARSIAGIWPVSLLLALFCQSHRFPADLLIVLPHPEALRIVFLKQRVPVLTRLAPTPGGTAAQIEEIVRTRRYLENIRAIERGQICPVLLLGPIEPFAQPLAAAQFELVAPPHPWDRHPPADWRLPLFDLALKSPAGQVAPIARRTDYLAHHLRRGALAASAVCLVAGLWAASGNLLAITRILGEQQRARNTAQQLLSDIARLEREMTGFDADPEILRRAIALDEDEIVSAPALASHLQTLAQALEATPGSRLSELKWQLLSRNEKPCGKDAAPGSGEATPGQDEAGRKRLTELAFTLTLPGDYGLSGQAQGVRRMSRQIAQIETARLIQDPAGDLDRGISLSSTASEEAARHTWCLSLPGDLRSAAKPTEKTQ
ncbi:MAG: hypothetical protein BWY57_02613 [Betaproteobacteria bacterium ADurb.Bin341]|nr:MAG: hypothetical protein BWY57_02613 [Betaproteobacteria bacterium ADurb.Bin341]